MVVWLAVDYSHNHCDLGFPLTVISTCRNTVHTSDLILQMHNCSFHLKYSNVILMKLSLLCGCEMQYFTPVIMCLRQMHSGQYFDIRNNGELTYQGTVIYSAHVVMSE
jgi:hypothetical protein